MINIKNLKNRFEKNFGKIEKIRPNEVKERTEEASHKKSDKKWIEEFKQKEIIAAEEKIQETRQTGGMISIANAQKKRQQREKQIEKILEEDLDQVYMELSPPNQMRFRQAGEETANLINNLLDKAKVKVAKILKLIKKWLSIIPSINNFFLEQTAKIKTDKILKIKRDKEN